MSNVQPTGPRLGVSIESAVATVTLDRADRRNAMTRAMVYGLIDVLDRLDLDDDVRAIVVTGAGAAFSVGADLEGGRGTFADTVDEPEADADRDVGGILALRLFACTKPLIAAINGDAVGIGATMTLPMDIRLAATSARFRFPFARRGIVPESCGSWFLPRIVGVSRAMEWLTGGALISSDDAVDAGLVRSLHAPDELVPAATELARRLTADTSPVSVAATRQLVWQGLTTPHPMIAHRRETRLLRALAGGPDATEGIAAFLERRDAHFTSRPSHDLSPFADWWRTPPYDEDAVT